MGDRDLRKSLELFAELNNERTTKTSREVLEILCEEVYKRGSKIESFKKRWD